LNIIRNRNENEIQIELNQIKNKVAEQREKEIEKYCQLFHFPLFRRLLLGIFIQIFDQLTGINSIIYYSPIIFKQINSFNFSN
jgi:hypothetical protein